MKHAFLIIAHNEPVLFKKLIACLDHPDVDIFVHIDRKSDMTLFDDVKTAHSFIYFIEDRIDVRWGDYSQILTEIKLFETASKRNRYLYYHLLSGIDLPIKPIDQILKWFEDRKGYEYLGAWPAEKKYHRRMHRRYFFITRKRNFATTMILALEKLFCLKWNRKTEVWMGSNWGSFTHDFVEQLLRHKDWIANHFKYSFCGDELYKPTLMRYLGIENQDKGGVRHIDWQRGNPYVFRNEDFDELMASDKLFARKFSSDDMELIERIIKYLRSEPI